MLLGVVAGARIYEQPLYPSFVGLIGAGAISALVVAIAIRWDAQVTAGLGITRRSPRRCSWTPHPRRARCLPAAGARAVSGFAIALRGWPWLLQVAIIASLPSPPCGRSTTALRRSAADRGRARDPRRLVGAARPARTVLRARPTAPGCACRPRVRCSRWPASAVLFGWLEFGSVHDAGFETLLCVLAACHLLAGAVMLRVASLVAARCRLRLGDRRRARCGRRRGHPGRSCAARVLGRRGARDALALRALRGQASRCHRGVARRADVGYRSRSHHRPDSRTRCGTSRPGRSRSSPSWSCSAGRRSCCAACARSRSALPSPPGSRSSTWPGCSSSASPGRPPARSIRLRSCSSRARGQCSPPPAASPRSLLPPRFRAPACASSPS